MSKRNVSNLYFIICLFISFFISLFYSQVNNAKCKKIVEINRGFPVDYVNLASTESSSDYMAIRIRPRPFLVHELAIGT